MRDPALDEDSDSVWTQIAELFVRGQSYTDFRLDRLDRNVATLQTDVAVLKTDVAGLKTDVAELKTDVAELKTDVAELKTDVAGLKTDVAGLKTGVAGLAERMDEHRQSTDREFNKVHAMLERIWGYIERDERS